MNARFRYRHRRILDPFPEFWRRSAWRWNGFAWSEPLHPVVRLLVLCGLVGWLAGQILA